jgi:hypothetical protein
MHPGIVHRARHAARIIIVPIWTIVCVFVVGTLLGVYQGLVSLFVPPDKRDRWDIWNILPPLGDGWWVIGGIIVIAAIFEGSFRVYRSLELQFSGLEKRLKQNLRPSFSMGDRTCVVTAPYGVPVLMLVPDPQVGSRQVSVVRNIPAKWFRLKIHNDGVDTAVKCAARL